MSSKAVAERYIESAEEKEDSGDYHGAISDATSSIEIHPCFEGYLLRAALRIETGDYMGAISDYTICLQHSENTVDDECVLRGRSEAWHQLGNLQNAIADLSEAIAISEYPNPDMYRERSALYTRMGDYEKAEIDTDIAEGRRMSAEAARKLLWEVIYKKAQDRILDGEYSAAEREYSEGVRQGDPTSHGNRGHLRLYYMNDEQGAIDDFTTALESKARSNICNRHKFFGNRGVALASMGERKKAIDDFSRAIKELCSDSEEASLYYHLRGIEKQKLGNLPGACSDWRIAADLGNMDSKRLVDECCREG